MPYSVETLVNGPLEENCYFLHATGQAQGILIDPGSSAPELKDALNSRGFKPKLILATHGHFDHVGAVAELAEAYGVPFGMADADRDLLKVLVGRSALYGMGPTREPKVDRILQAGEDIQAAGLTLVVLATPGHTPGGLCFLHQASGSLFSGDTLFEGSVGRSDLPGGSHDTLISGIRRELLSLPDATQVFPGHGEATSIGDERRQNPYLR